MSTSSDLSAADIDHLMSQYVSFGDDVGTPSAPPPKPDSPLHNSLHGYSGPSHGVGRLEPEGGSMADYFAVQPSHVPASSGGIVYPSGLSSPFAYTTVHPPVGPVGTGATHSCACVAHPLRQTAVECLVTGLTQSVTLLATLHPDVAACRPYCDLVHHVNQFGQYLRYVLY